MYIPIYHDMMAVEVPVEMVQLVTVREPKPLMSRTTDSPEC